MITLADLRAACEGRRLLVYAGRGSTFWGLHDLFTRNVVLCADDSPEYDGVEDTTFLNQERIAGVRTGHPPDAHFLSPDLWAAVQAHIDGSGWLAMELRTAPQLAECADRVGIARHTLATDLMSRLNHKRTLFEVQDALGLPRAQGEWSQISAETFGHWTARFGLPLVVQSAVGEAGYGTVFIHDEVDWHQAATRFGDTDIWIAPYLGAWSLNINAIAIPGASVASYPSVQLTGFEFLNHSEGMYCGNDFSATAMLPQHLIHDVREQTERIGNCIAAFGFRGLFGLDFVVRNNDGVAHAVDLNPRWQGSTPLQGQAERRASRVPLPATALLYSAGLIGGDEAAQAAVQSSLPLEAAQVRVRWPGAGIHVVAHPPRPGIYSPSGQWKRPGVLLEQLNDGEVLLTGAPPRPGTRIESGAQYYRLYTLNSVLMPGTLNGSAAIRDLVHAIMNADLDERPTTNDQRLTTNERRHEHRGEALPRQPQLRGDHRNALSLVGGANPLVQGQHAAAHVVVLGARLERPG